MSTAPSLADVACAHDGPHPVQALTVARFAGDMRRVAVPRAEAQVVVRFGPALPSGVDVHAMGARTQVQRKFVRGGQQAVLARLQPGLSARVLGLPADALAGRVLPLEDLWGRAATQRLLEGLVDAPDAYAAGRMLSDALSAQASARHHVPAPSPGLRAALARLQVASVAVVARDLGISERQLRRMVRHALGVGPKTYARLKRFEHAVHAARAAPPHWAALAADAGYYDQAHLIAEFHAIAGATPQAFLAELRGVHPAL